MCGCPSRLKSMRSIAFASVAVPTVERGLAPIRSWSTMIAVESFEYVDLRARQRRHEALHEGTVRLVDRRCDSAAIVENTSELLPEPETPVNTVSCCFGISTLTSFEAVHACAVHADQIVAVGNLQHRRLRVRLRHHVSRCSQCLDDAERRSRDRHSSVLKQPKDVAIGIGDGGHQAAATDIVRGPSRWHPRRRLLGQLRPRSGTRQ